MKIVNLSTFKGGKRRLRHLGGVYCGRPSPLGNPFSHKKDSLADTIVASREEAIEAYRRWLWIKLKEFDPVVIRAMSELKEDSILGCWCRPLACHCEVIERAWRWMRTSPAYSHIFRKPQDLQAT